MNTLVFIVGLSSLVAVCAAVEQLDDIVPNEDDVHKVLIEGEDVTSLMDEDELQSWSENADGTPLIEKFRRVDRNGFDVTFHIDVRLVGFEGILKADLLTKHLDTMHEPRGEQVHVLHPHPPEEAGSQTPPSGATAKPHALNVFGKVIFEASESFLPLTSKVNHLVDEMVVQRENSFVPISAMDNILADHFDQTPSHASYVLYIINPKLPVPVTDEKNGDITRAPVYWYFDKEEKSYSRVPCGLVSWAASSRRYAWIDIAAGPAHYGPRSAGDGGIFEHSLPRASEMKSGLAAKLAAVVWRTAQHLFFPSMHHYPVLFTPLVTVQIVYISDQPIPAGNNKSSLYWNTIKKSLNSMGMFGQTVEVRYNHISLKDCPLCITALENSIKSHTSTTVGIHMETHVHQYLDSKEMVYWLKKFGSEYWGLKREQKENDRERIVPVYVFDLQKRDDMLLLDRLHQSVFYDGVVVSVETEGDKALLNYECSGNALFMAPKDARRSTFASILKAVWGLSDTRERWEPLRETIGTDFLWSASNSPFGPFARSINSLSFSQKDAAARNLIYSHVNKTLAQLHRIFQDVDRFRIVPSHTLSYEKYARLLSRWNMLDYKLHRASKYLSAHDFRHALFFVYSTKADVMDIAGLLDQARGNVEVEIVCTGQYSLNEVLLGDVGAFWLWSGGLMLLFCAINAKRTWDRHWENLLSDTRWQHDDRPTQRIEFEL